MTAGNSVRRYNSAHRFPSSDTTNRWTVTCTHVDCQRVSTGTVLATRARYQPARTRGVPSRTASLANFPTRLGSGRDLQTHQLFGCSQPQIVCERQHSCKPGDDTGKGEEQHTKQSDNQVIHSEPASGEGRTSAAFGFSWHVGSYLFQGTWENELRGGTKQKAEVSLPASTFCTTPT